ncbi:EF-hand domain-containing protein [Ralstonia sp. UBA689]|uniref:EF-hand domain-containing protein n=1 Tax=Ralstonia sp. UBA689 TaxID=1947373 RepID=UPI0025EEB632|nr:EF-hand domain-containing protein [Ralstonia sp. UBA689]
MTNKRAVQAFLATSALFLAMAGMNARAQEASAPAAQAPATTQAPQTTPRAAKPGRHGGFKAIDTNGDGQISRDEAKGHAWLEKNFDQIDTNHDGQLSKEELAAWRKAHKGEMRGEARAKMAERFDVKFKAADKNSDGVLTKDEMQAGMPKLAKQFDQIDANHDGKVTEDEIRAYMKARHDARKAQKAASATAAPSTTQTQ